jgi:putative transposase
LKEYLRSTHGIAENYLIVDVPNHLQLQTDSVKTIELKPLANGKYEVIVVVDIPDVEEKPNGEKFLSIDLGVNNLLSCYVYDGSSMIFSGRQLLSINRYYDKIIAHYRHITALQQTAEGVKYPKETKRISLLYEKRRKQVHHQLHTMSRQLIETALDKGVETIVIGNITGVRDGSNFGSKTNQKFHRLPFRKIKELITYKAKEAGISVVSDITEEYTSQTCSVCKEMPCKENACKTNRKHRGMYACKECGTQMNADINGAINISKKYLESFQTKPVVVLVTPEMYRFNGRKFINGNPKLAISIAM